jgi:putative endonuclease
MKFDHTTGELGESLAIRYLVRHGFTVVAQNVRYPWGEIDIVARRRGVQVFVEVKTQGTHKAGTDGVMRPEERVDQHKRRRLQRAVQTHWMQAGATPAVFTFVVLVVLVDTHTRSARFRWIEEPL